MRFNNDARQQGGLLKSYYPCHSPREIIDFTGAVVFIISYINLLNAIFEKNDIKFRIHIRHHMPYYPPSFHLHAEIIHILSGDLRVSVNGIQKNLKAGDTSGTLPYVIHSYEESRDFEAIALMLDPSVANLYEKKLITYKHINPFLSQNEEIPTLMKRILGSYESDKKDDLLTNIYLQALIGEIFLSVQENRKENVDAGTIQKGLIYCSEHYTEDITVKKVSADLVISQSTITKIFSDIFQQTKKSKQQRRQLPKAD